MSMYTLKDGSSIRLKHVEVISEVWQAFSTSERPPDIFCFTIFLNQNKKLLRYPSREQAEAERRAIIDAIDIMDKSYDQE